MAEYCRFPEVFRYLKNYTRTTEMLNAKHIWPNRKETQRRSQGKCSKWKDYFETYHKKLITFCFNVISFFLLWVYVALSKEKRTLMFGSFKRKSRELCALFAISFNCFLELQGFLNSVLPTSCVMESSDGLYLDSFVIKEVERIVASAPEIAKTKRLGVKSYLLFRVSNWLG